MESKVTKALLFRLKAQIMQFCLQIAIFFVHLSDENALKQLPMKRFWYTVALTIALGFTCCACGGKGSKTSSLTEQTNELSAAPSELETDTIDEDDGDPNIKAASPSRMRMVVDGQGNVVGRYVSANETTYTVSVQDDIEVPMTENSVVTFSAKNGQGVVFTRRTNVNVRTQPSLEAPAFIQISCPKGETPKTYPCLGKTQGWYKILIKGKEGYVRHDLVEWDGMDTF